MKRKVLIGLSGGVDSSVAAYILKEQGYDVTALFMINWKDSTVTLSGDCSWEEDLIMARLVARKLDIPLEIVDSSERYKQSVVEYMFDEYRKGRTPNPDILCNRNIKFEVFREAAQNYKADFIATGHYAKTEVITNSSGTFTKLLMAGDQTKDQSYFLCQLSQAQLRNVLFPLGDIPKTEVRRIAAQLGLATATRKDSQGICFVGKVDLPVFLQQKLSPKKGAIIEIDPSDPAIIALQEKYNQTSVLSLPEYCCGHDFASMAGKQIGEHSGAHYLTIGQRKGLNIGGKSKPLFVLGTDVVKNIVYVGQGDDHPGLSRKGLFINLGEIHWIRTDFRLRAGEKIRCSIRIRYRQPLQNGCLYMENAGMYIVFDELQRSIAPGQFAAWYYGNELVGSGVID